jgi:hypothetical protein
MIHDAGYRMHDEEKNQKSQALNPRSITDFIFRVSDLLA